MLNFDAIDSQIDGIETFRKTLITTLRGVYKTAKSQGIDCAGDEEIEILEAIGSEENLFEDCSIEEILEIVDLLKKWNRILKPESV